MGTALNNIYDTDKPYWFVMMAYKQEKAAEEVLSGKNGLEYYIAKHYVIRTRNGKKEKYLVPYIPNIIFVHASHTQIIKFKEKYNFLKFVTWEKSTGMEYLIVPDKQMRDFIKISSCEGSNIRYYNTNEINIKKGTPVRIHGGKFDGIEGIFLKVKGKRNKQVVVIIPDVLAVSAEVDPDLIEVL